MKGKKTESRLQKKTLLYSPLNSSNTWILFPFVKLDTIQIFLLICFIHFHFPPYTHAYIPTKFHFRNIFFNFIFCSSENRLKIEKNKFFFGMGLYTRHFIVLLTSRKLLEQKLLSVDFFCCTRNLHFFS